MLEGLWGINPNLIENIPYYVSIMPLQYRKELLKEVYINKPMDSKFDYNTWKDNNFDEDYNVIDITYEDYNVRTTDMDKMTEDANRYYFLLFFFSAFKRKPEREERIRVEEWIARCLVDVLAKDPTITPYYPAIRNWRGPRNIWQMPYETLVTLSQINGLGAWYMESDERDVAIRDLLKRRDADNLGLTQVYNGGIYDLFISDCFDLSDVSSESIFSHYIKATYIDEEAYYNNGEDLKQNRLKGYGLTNKKLDKSFGLFKDYWREFGYLIPIGFLSKTAESLRFMNYSIKSFENLK